MKKRIAIYSAILISATAIAAPLDKQFGKKQPAKTIEKTDGKQKLTALPLNDFLSRALANNPTIKKIQARYKEERSLSLKTAAIQDLTLRAGTDLDWYNKVYSSGSLTAGDKGSWSLYATLSRRFPKLLGMDAALSFTHTSTTSSSGGSHSPNLSLTLTIPLLRNFLGKVDTNDLKRMHLALKIVERAEQEAYEAFLLTLHYAYIDWALATETVTIYQGGMNRSAVLLNQTVRKQRLGIADAADLALARQNYLSYETRYLSALSHSNSRYLELMAQMAGKKRGPAQKTRGRYTPVINWETGGKKSALPSLNDLRAVQTARLILEDAKLTLHSAGSSLKPDLNLILKGGTGSSQSSFGRSFSTLDQNNLYSGLELTLPLQNTERKKAKDAALAAYKKYLAEYQELRIAMSYSLITLDNAIKTSTTSLKVQKQVVAASLLRLSAFYQKYSQGRVSLDRVTDARDAYATQQIRYIEMSAALKKLRLQYDSLADRLSSAYPLQK